MNPCVSVCICIYGCAWTICRHPSLAVLSGEDDPGWRVALCAVRFLARVLVLYPEGCCQEGRQGGTLDVNLFPPPASVVCEDVPCGTTSSCANNREENFSVEAE